MGTLLFIILLVMGAGLIVYWQNHKDDVNVEERKQADDLLEKTRILAERAQVMIQAGIVGDDKTIQALNDGTYNGPWPKKRKDGGYLSLYDTLRILKVAGINHRQNVGQYTGRLEVALVPEPNNQFDSNAIKVVAEDSHHLGYVESHFTEFVRTLALNTFPYRCVCFIEEHKDKIDGHIFYTGFLYIRQNTEIKRE